MEPSALLIRRGYRAFLLMTPLLLTACIGGKTPPSQFYLLEPMQVAAAEPLQGKPATISLGLVRVPQYLDRPQIVSATGRNTLSVDELNRWAEPLDSGISRVLMQNLALLVPANVLSASATRSSQGTDLRVGVHILQFHVDPAGDARLSAQWQITTPDGGTLNVRQGTYRAPASNNDFRVVVGGLNQCLDAFSRDLASAIRESLAR